MHTLSRKYWPLQPGEVRSNHGTAQKVVTEECGDCSEQREGYTEGMRMSGMDKC